MIRYPELKPAVMGVTAPSSGVEKELHHLLQEAEKKQRERGFGVVIGETARTQHHARSAPAEQRAQELMAMLKNDEIGLIIPPWGGELLIEVLEHLDFSAIPPKWILGYSDLSVLLLTVTLKTGIATAHGTNFIDLRGEETDPTTACFLNVLQTPEGGTVTQQASERFQAKWDHENPSPAVFHLTEPTEWKTVSGEPETFSGRLLGGCIDVIRHLIGTPYGDVKAFREAHIPEEPVLWYLENCELSATDLKRSLVQMKYAGWFDHIDGILFGRSPANHPVEDYTAETVYRELSEELGVPVAFDLDLGHMPPQITFINGAQAEVEVRNGSGTVRQFFK